MKKISTIVALCLIFVIKGWSQDPQFSQFYSSLLYLSPSFTGSSEGSRGIMNLRDQWLKLPGTYITGTFSFDHYFERYKSGVGVLILQDMAGGGLFNVTNTGLLYSFNFNITNTWQIRPGLQFYYTTRSLNFDKLTFSDQISKDFILPSSIEILENRRIGHFDITSSVLAYSEKYWFGITVDHIMSYSAILRDELGYLPIRYSIFGGAKYMIYRRTLQILEESVSFAFNLLYQDPYKYLDVGTYYLKERLAFGLLYRGVPMFKDNPNAGAISLLFGYKFDKLSLGYSYDFSLSKLITKTGGAHEVSVTYDLMTDSRKRKRRRAVPCPNL